MLVDRLLAAGIAGSASGRPADSAVSIQRVDEAVRRLQQAGVMISRSRQVLLTMTAARGNERTRRPARWRSDAVTLRQ